MASSLKDVLAYEKELYIPNSNFLRELKLWWTNEPVYFRWRFVYYLRKSEFWRSKNTLIAKIIHSLYRRKKKYFRTFVEY